MKYEYFIGLRYLRAKRRQTFVSVITGIAVLGVAVGVAALIIVLSGMTGVEDYMRDRILGFNAHLIVSRFGGIENPAEIVEKLNEVPGVTGASPFVEAQAMLRGRGNGVGVLVRGIDPDTVRDVMDLGPGIILEGSLPELAEGSGIEQGDTLPAIGIGEELKDELGVFYGDELTVIIPEGTLTPLGMRPKAVRFRVGLVYKFGFYEVDSTVALMDMSLAERLFKSGAGVDGIEVKVTDIYAVDDMRKKIGEALGPSYIATTWIQQQRQLFAALKMEQLLSGLALSLIMLVASFNIVSMLLMVVMEKYRDIAILKSMGATDGGVMRIFIIQGTVIGVVGAVLGTMLGLFMCWLQIRYGILKFPPEVYQFSTVPMKITLWNSILPGLGAIFISFLTTLYPSRQAARMKPAEALRYE